LPNPAHRNGRLAKARLFNARVEPRQQRGAESLKRKFARLCQEVRRREGDPLNALHTLGRKTKRRLDDERACHQRCSKKNSGSATTERGDGSQTTLVAAHDAKGALVPGPAEIASLSSAVITPRTASLDDEGSGVLGVIARVRAPRDSVACTMAEAQTRLVQEPICTCAQELHLLVLQLNQMKREIVHQLQTSHPQGIPVRTSSCSKPTSCCG